MLACSPEPVAEEWAIHDFEGFGLAYISEYESLETVSRLAQGIAEHGLAFAAWAAVQNNDEEALGRFEDAYLGNWESLEEYADEMLCGLDLDEARKLLPEGIRPYLVLDVEAFARDLELKRRRDNGEGPGRLGLGVRRPCLVEREGRSATPAPG